MPKSKYSDKIITFDASSLGNIYLMTESAKESIGKIFESLKPFIWISGHAKEEFIKNYDKITGNVINDCYHQNSIPSVALIQEKTDKIIGKIEENANYHPMISEEGLNTVKEAYTKATEALQSIHDTLTSEFDQKKQEIRDIRTNDTLLEKISGLTTGAPMTIQTKLKVAQEGETRYKLKVPPGYRDDKDKEGLQKYGDLYVWKQIIEKAKQSEKDVLLVLDDNKNDWWTEKNSPELQPLLIREFEEETGRKIEAMRLVEFFTSAKDCADEEAQIVSKKDYDEVIESLTNIRKIYNSQNRSPQPINFYCNHCGRWFDISLHPEDWNDEVSDFRNQGIEKTHYADKYEVCENCGNPMEVQFEACEYPPGDLETYNIETQQCKLWKEPRRRDLNLPFDQPEDEG